VRVVIPSDVAVVVTVLSTLTTHTFRDLGHIHTWSLHPIMKRPAVNALRYKTDIDLIPQTTPGLPDERGQEVDMRLVVKTIMYILLRPSGLTLMLH